MCLLATYSNVQQGSRLSGHSFGHHSDTINIVGVGTGVKNFFLTCNVSGEKKKTPDRGDSRGLEARSYEGDAPVN